MKAYKLKWMDHSLELGHRTHVMGILNVTPDSFSDGGKFSALDKAISHAEQMVMEGADIIDIGGESSRPFSEPVSAEEEMRRVLPVIEHLAPRLDVPISIDTTKSEVARRAIEAGASIINDISALGIDGEIGRVAAKTGALLILMHMLGSPKTMQIRPEYTNLFEEIKTYLEKAIKKAVTAGVPKDKIIVDPGIGFGKTTKHNLQLIHHIDRMDRLDTPVLLGPSRKAFIRKTISGCEELPVGHPDIESGTQAVIAAAAIKGIHIVRVHRVAETRKTLRIIDAIRTS
ncbi:MAG: dihydropteroate synthase [Deltaproteobacteria bacterium]|nr:dihydropteroate synthase [Deltaproteobacteria bacterium]